MPSKAQVIRVFEPNPASLPAAVQAFLATCRAKNLSPNTTAYYSYRLRAFERFLEDRGEVATPQDVSPRTIREFLEHEREHTSATTASHSHTALSAFFGYLLSDGLIEHNPVVKVDKPRRRKSLVPTLADTQVEAILATCGRDFYGARDRAILLMMLDTGVRVAELVSLRLVDVSLERQVMIVVGKGDKERELPFGSSVRSCLTSYLARRGDTGNTAFFVNHYGEALTRYSVRDMIIRRGTAAKVEGVRLSPHTFRHTFAKSWLVNGGDAFSLQRMLGHTTMDMVRNYVNLITGEVAAIHRAVSPADRLQGTRQGPRKRIR